MPRGHVGLPLHLQLTEVHPIRLIAVAVGVSTMPNFDEEAYPLEPLNRSYDRAPALTGEMRNAIKAWIALLGAAVKAVDDGGRNLLVRTGQRFGEADNFEGERRV